MLSKTVNFWVKKENKKFHCSLLRKDSQLEVGMPKLVTCTKAIDTNTLLKKKLGKKEEYKLIQSRGNENINLKAKTNEL